MLKKSIYLLLNLLWRPILFFSGLKITGGKHLLFFCSKITCLPGNDENSLECSAPTTIRNCSFRIGGQKNRILLGGDITNSRIRIEGNKNEFILENTASFKNTEIVIIGTNCKIRIGRGTTINGACMVTVGTENTITLGEDCMLADGIQIWASDTHAIYEAASNQLLNPSKSISIGKHVWLGVNSMVLKGVSIGNNTIIGMGTLITKDVPANSICVGNPQRIQKQGVRWERGFIDR